MIKVFGWFEHYALLKGTLDVSDKALNGLPMALLHVFQVLGEATNRKGSIRSDAYHQVHQTADLLEIGSVDRGFVGIPGDFLEQIFHSHGCRFIF